MDQISIEKCVLNRECVYLEHLSLTTFLMRADIRSHQWIRFSKHTLPLCNWATNIWHLWATFIWGIMVLFHGAIIQCYIFAWNADNQFHKIVSKICLQSSASWWSVHVPVTFFQLCFTEKNSFSLFDLLFCVLFNQIFSFFPLTMNNMANNMFVLIEYTKINTFCSAYISAIWRT